MGDEQDWRLRVDLPDAAGLHARLRDARDLEREIEPEIGRDVVLSHDDRTLFAYASSRAAIDNVRRSLEAQLAADSVSAPVVLSHWDERRGRFGDWRQVDPPPDPQESERERAASAEQAEGAIETRTVAISSGRMVRHWFETTVVDEAREAGVEIEIVEHPHLLTTQIAFTLTGPSEKIDTVIADLQARAMQVTRLETNFGIIS